MLRGTWNGREEAAYSVGAGAAFDLTGWACASLVRPYVNFLTKHGASLCGTGRKDMLKHHLRAISTVRQATTAANRRNSPPHCRTVSRRCKRNASKNPSWTLSSTSPPRPRIRQEMRTTMGPHSSIKAFHSLSKRIVR